MTRKLTAAEREERKVARAATQRRTQREREAHVLAENRAVDAACRLLRGIQPENVGLGGNETYQPRDDLGILARIISIAGRHGRAIADYPERPFVVLMVAPQTTRLFRRAAKLLSDWCRRGKRPPVIEAISTSIAALFLRELLGRGRHEESTINKFRDALAHMWDHAIRQDEEILNQMRGEIEVLSGRCFPATKPMENPWRQPETKLHELKKLSSLRKRVRISLIPHRCKCGASPAQRTNAPATRKRDALAHAESIRHIYDEMRARGLSRTKMAWELQNIYCVSRPNGGRWHPTLVGRDLARLYPSSPKA
jgi:hypothetical protein